MDTKQAEIDFKVKPNDCVLAFGIPTNKAQFLEDIENPAKDFADLFDGSWHRYNHQVIKPFNSVIPKLKKWGVEILPSISLAQFGQVLTKNEKKSFTLFSHWAENQVEFSDGLIPIEDIIDHIPKSFKGVLDLCICHPNALVLKIKEERPNCQVRFISNKEATPLFWL